MKIIFLLILMGVFASLKAFGAPICSYQELTSAIYEGKRFVILLDLQQCTKRSGMPIGYFTPKSMMLRPATETTLEYVVTSDLHFTDHGGKPTYEYVKCTFNSDNTVLIQTIFYNAPSFDSRGSPHTFKCTLGKGVEIHSNNS